MDMQAQPPFDSFRRGPIEDYQTGPEEIRLSPPPQTGSNVPIIPPPAPPASQSGAFSPIRGASYQRPASRDSVSSSRQRAMKATQAVEPVKYEEEKPKKRTLIQRILRR